jgi:hypothetical protein
VILNSVITRVICVCVSVAILQENLAISRQCGRKPRVCYLLLLSCIPTYLPPMLFLNYWPPSNRTTGPGRFFLLSFFFTHSCTAIGLENLQVDARANGSPLSYVGSRFCGSKLRSEHIFRSFVSIHLGNFGK